MVAGGVVAGGGAVRRGHCDRRARPTRLGWLDGLGRQLDALTDAVLGEAATSEIGDGCAEAYEGETSAAAAEAEAAAAAGFDGATLAALLVGRWGQEYDIDFTKTDYLGKSSLYLNVFPWTADQEPWCATRHTPHATRLGTPRWPRSPRACSRAAACATRGRRHTDRQAYLEHLQAVAELLLRWGRVASVTRQIDESDKQPRRGTVPLLTVPIRLDLPNELVKSFRP